MRKRKQHAGRAGRKRFVPTQRDLKIAYEMAQEGATNVLIAARLKVSIDTLDALKKRNRQFSQAIAEGTEQGVHDAKLAVQQIIQDKKHRDRLRAALALLRAKDPAGGWRENVEISGDPERPIGIAMPSVQQLLKHLAGGKKKPNS